MSFCPIDEAFGNYLTGNLNPNPLESTIHTSSKGNQCESKYNNKKKKINCNRKHTSFTMNPDDIYVSSPDVSEDDEEFNQNLQNYNPYQGLDLYNIQSENPIKKCKKKKRRPKKNTVVNSLSNNLHAGNYSRSSQEGCLMEGFEDYNTVQPNKVFKVKKTNKNSKPRRPEVNEVFEYNEEDNRPIDKLNYVHGNDDTDSEIEETRPIFKPKKKSSEINTQISEINNKINFIMNQISNKDDEDSDKTYNNINDIILFVIFGVFVLIVIEGLYRLISKIIRANSILNIRKDSMSNHLPSSRELTNKKGGGSLDENIVSSKDPIEMFTDYLRKK